MKSNNKTRRDFIKSSIILGGISVSVPEPMSSFDTRVEPTTKESNLVFLFQGDSITDGNRGRNLDPNHIMGHGYAFSVSSRIGTDFPDRGFTFYNRGVSGNKVSDLSARWQEETIALKPDVLSILVGINDASALLRNPDKGSDLKEFESSYRQLLSDARSVNSKVILVLGLPFVYPVGKIVKDWEFYRADVSKRSAIVVKLAKEFDALVVDYKLVFDKAIKKMPIDYWVWDGIHPTIFGHELMARLWIKRVSDRLRFLTLYADK